MGEKDLIKLRGKGDAYSDAVRSKLKGSSSEKRKIAMKINAIPRMKDNVEKEILKLISNPELSAIQIQKCLQKALDRNLSDRDFIALIGIMISKHRALFGSKIELSADIKLEEIRRDFILEKQALRLLEYKYLEECFKNWTQEFGEEKAELMKDAILFKYQIGLREIQQVKEGIRNVMINAGNNQYKKIEELKNG